MRDFKPQYCALLKKQVEEEIAYLRNHGHNTRYPLTPCIFCAEFKNGYVCYRIEQLTQFLSEIVVKMNTSPLQAIINPVLSSQNDLMPLIGFSG